MEKPTGQLISSSIFDENAIRYLLNCDQTFSLKLKEWVFASNTQKPKPEFTHTDFVMLGEITSR